MEGDEGGDARGGLDASEVEDGLWVGGHPAPGQVTEDDFDVLVLLARGNQQDGLAGVGVSAAPTRSTGASSQGKQVSPMRAASSAPGP